MSDWKRIERREVCRYLGVRGAQPDEALAVLIDRAIRRVIEAATPRVVTRIMDVQVQQMLVRLGALTWDSADLSKHLTGCDKVILFAATLGGGVDRLLQRDTLIAPSLAVTEQAAAAALMEAYADDCCRELSQSLERQNRYLRPRYSPGYGDFSLEAQPLLLELLNANKRIGLTATSAHMLTPTKSVTAVIGMSDHQRGCYTGGCTMCSKCDCLFRKEEIM